MTPISARPVEEVAPDPKRQTPVPVAAPKPDVMTVPTKPPVKPPKPETKPATTPLASPAVTKPPTTGRQVQTGTSAVETGARGIGAGLTVGGGGGGAQLKVDSDFCCPAYLQEVVTRISGVWRSVQPEHGTTVADLHDPARRQDYRHHAGDVERQLAARSSLARDADGSGAEAAAASSGVHTRSLDDSLELSLPGARTMTKLFGAAGAIAIVLATVPAAQPVAAWISEPLPQQTEFKLSLVGLGSQPKVGLPDFTVEAGDKELSDAVAMLVDVLWADLDYEKEYYLIPRKASASIPVVADAPSLPFRSVERNRRGVRDPRQRQEARGQSRHRIPARQRARGLARRGKVQLALRRHRAARSRTRASARTSSRTTFTRRRAISTASRARSSRSRPIATRRG